MRVVAGRSFYSTSETWQSGRLHWFISMIYDDTMYSLLPRGEATYFMRIGKYWYVGHTVNLYNRAKHRKSVLMSGSCNERLVQKAFSKVKVLPAYKILSTSNKETRYYQLALKKLGKAFCLNILPGGDNVSSAPNSRVHARISASNKRWAATPEGKRSIQKAIKASAQKRSIPVIVDGVYYESKQDCADSLGIPRGSINSFLRKLEV